MTFTVDAISRCSGNNHIKITATMDGTVRVIELVRSDFDIEPSEIFEAAVRRIRSAVKEANASTPAQIQNALVGKTFKV